MPARNHDDDDEAVTFGMPGRGSGGGGGGARFDTRVFDASCQQLTSLPPALHAGELSGVRELTLAFNALTSLDGLSGVASVGGSLSIWYNYALCQSIVDAFCKRFGGCSAYGNDDSC